MNDRRMLINARDRDQTHFLNWLCEYLFRVVRVLEQAGHYGERNDSGDWSTRYNFAATHRIDIQDYSCDRRGVPGLRCGTFLIRLDMGSPGRPYYPQPINIKRLADECPLKNAIVCHRNAAREETRVSVLAAYRDNGWDIHIGYRASETLPSGSVKRRRKSVVCGCIINALGFNYRRRNAAWITRTAAKTGSRERSRRPRLLPRPFSRNRL